MHLDCVPREIYCVILCLNTHGPLAGAGSSTVTVTVSAGHQLTIQGCSVGFKVVCMDLLYRSNISWRKRRVTLVAATILRAQ